MIRIMHVTSTLRFGGLERILRDFAAYLDRETYQFSACALDADGVVGEEIQEMGLPVFVLGKKPGVDLKLPLALYRLFRTERIDIVHTHNFSPLLYAALPARFAGVRGIVHTDHNRIIRPDVMRRMVVERWLSHCVDIITAVSTQVKRDLVRYEKIHPDRIRVIRNGINTAPPVPNISPHDLRRDLGISPDAQVVGVCSRLAAGKGIMYLLQAAGPILKLHPGTVFLIVGDGEAREDLERMADRVCPNKSVIFTGFRSDIQNILGLLDVYVLPSLFEGTPLGLLEAMAVGKAVVATRVGSNEEIVEDGVTGRLIDPRRADQLVEAIGGFLSSPSNRERMGCAAAEHVRSLFSLDRMMREYDMLYQTLLDQKKELN